MKIKTVKKTKKELPGLKTNVFLKNRTTFKIGGRARYFFVAKTKEKLISAIKFAEKKKIPFFIIGSGSNLLVDDKGFRGLVIRVQNSKFKIQKQNSKFKIICGAGLNLGALVNLSLKKSLTGMEWAAGIPGTVGGAVYGNAGAFGKSMKDVTKTITVLEIPNPKSQIPNKFKIKKLKNKECRFGYKDSIFKVKKNLIILEAELQFKKGKKKDIKQKVKKHLAYKKVNQPLDFPSAGSVFKNFSLTHKNLSPLIKKLRKSKKTKFVSAAELIEKCNLKGKKIGNVKISEKHANFIVNLGNGKAKDVKKLINFIKNKIKKRFGVNLEEEIRFLK